jgi:hypothetical protein
MKRKILYIEFILLILDNIKRKQHLISNSRYYLFDIIQYLTNTLTIIFYYYNVTIFYIPLSTILNRFYHPAISS